MSDEIKELNFGAFDEENNDIAYEDDYENIEIDDEEKREMEDSLKLNNEEIDITPIIKENTVSTEIKTPSSDISDETKNLYSEFNSFLETKTDIKQTSGEKIVIPTGIDLVDAVLGGGFAVGALNILVGNPGSGKTMLAIQAMANAQKIYKGEILCGFLDSEESTTAIRLSNLGVRYPRIKPYGDLTIEKVFKYIEGLCLFKEQKKIVDKPSFIIWDSIVNTTTQKEREVDDVNSVIGYKARLLSMMVPKYVAKLNQYNICLVAINQLRESISMGPYSAPKDLKFMSSSKEMPGGQALKFNAFQLGQMQTRGVVEREKYNFDGTVSELKLVKNKIFSPNIKIELVGDFVRGFNNFWTNYKFLVDTKRLKSGAWNYLINAPEIKFRTKDAYQKYQDEPEFKMKYDESVKEAILNEIIIPNSIEAY